MNDLFILTTIIDITRTDVLRGSSKERNQQRNWETVLQVLGLKTQPRIGEGPIILDSMNFKSKSGLKQCFGEFYHDMASEQRVWAVKFDSEHTDVYTPDQLYQDFDQVPIILGLDETARFMLPIFNSYGALKNIHFFRVEELNNY